MKTNVYIKNRKASYDYFVEDSLVAGIVLKGTEIKSIRQGKASLVDSFCMVVDNEVFAHFSIQPYENGSYYNHEERRPRKLLLNKREIRDVAKHAMVKGNTIVPLALYVNENGLAKLSIGLCKGKKSYDKREAIKQRDQERDLRNL